MNNSQKSSKVQRRLRWWSIFGLWWWDGFFLRIFKKLTNSPWNRRRLTWCRQRSALPGSGSHQWSRERSYLFNNLTFFLLGWILCLFSRFQFRCRWDWEKCAGIVKPYKSWWCCQEMAVDVLSYWKSPKLSQFLWCVYKFCRYKFCCVLFTLVLQIELVYSHAWKLGL